MPTTAPADLAAALARLVDPNNPPLATASTIGGSYRIWTSTDGREFYLAAYADGPLLALTGWTAHLGYPDAVQALAVALTLDEAREMGEI